MELTAQDIQNLKGVEFEILKAFIKICDDLKLHYYLIGGTLIGAVRHKGFIPWDDDIDVCMPREDYDIFLEKAQDLLPDSCFLQTHSTDPEYQCSFAKIRNSNTTFIESSTKSRHINHGVYIDIFPLDFYPEKKFNQRMVNMKDFLLNASISRLHDSKPSKKMRVAQIIASCIFPSADKAVDKRSEFMKKQKPSALYRNYCGAWGMREIWNVEWFGEGTDVEFEGIVAKAPSNYDAVMRHVYGDYMKLPPEEKRVAHHFCEKFDAEKSYKEYV